MRKQAKLTEFGLRLDGRSLNRAAKVARAPRRRGVRLCGAGFQSVGATALRRRVAEKKWMKHSKARFDYTRDYGARE